MSLPNETPVASSPRPPEYKGAPLDAGRGPGLGCFWVQVVLLAVFIVLAPLSAVLNWGPALATIFLIGVLVLLLLVGQTSIFLLRLVAADRKGRRAPLRSATKTVGQIDDEQRSATGDDVGESR
ncbi:MAG: hypothetical protein RLZZ432_793 [Chloroflexota bacterium]|jgi:hypothetical protein